MAEITTAPDGSASITVSSTEISGIKSLAEQHLPFLKRAEKWFDADIAPELREARTFLEGLAANPTQGLTLNATASEVKTLSGMLAAHVPDFQQVLAVVESPAVKSLLNLAKALI